MDTIINLIISLLSGAAGGNAAGAALKDKNLGTLGNTVTGLLGGVGGNYLLQVFEALGKTDIAGAVASAPAATGTGFDIASILANIASSGVGGAVLAAVVGFIKSALNKA